MYASSVRRGGFCGLSCEKTGHSGKMTQKGCILFFSFFLFFSCSLSSLFLLFMPLYILFCMFFFLLHFLPYFCYLCPCKYSPGSILKGKGAVHCDFLYDSIGGVVHARTTWQTVLYGGAVVIMHFTQ